MGENWYIIVEEHAIVREEPDINSKELTKLRITDLVKVTDKNESNTAYENLSGWLYVDTGRYEDFKKRTILHGWIQVISVATTERFRRVHQFSEYEIREKIGDYLLAYKFNENGTYNREILKYGERSTILKNGALFSYKNVIFANDEDGNGFELFYIHKDESLCTKYTHSDSTPICATRIIKPKQ
ncbi:MAG: hypothetical protein EPN93_06130 [Spirochaetes bacterium]|nr:MAG: hypothetical protein EPN93_06130 [Spirochaetota bacterium]